MCLSIYERTFLGPERTAGRAHACCSQPKLNPQDNQEWFLSSQKCWAPLRVTLPQKAKIINKNFSCYILAIRETHVYYQNLNNCRGKCLPSSQTWVLQGLETGAELGSICPIWFHPTSQAPGGFPQNLSRNRQQWQKIRIQTVCGEWVGDTPGCSKSSLSHTAGDHS